MIILPSWFVKKGFNNRRRNKMTGNRGTQVKNSGIGSQKRITMVQLIGFGDRERRMGSKEQRLKIRERGREKRTRDVRLGSEDGRQGTEK
jgi:hypothetical protein